jgi:hypothetical protein
MVFPNKLVAMPVTPFADVTKTRADREKIMCTYLQFASHIFG